MYNIYSDSSICNKTLGVGCYIISQVGPKKLTILEGQVGVLNQNGLEAQIHDTMKTVKKETNKSTLMEIYTIIQALDELTTKCKNIQAINIYTDCQGFVKLVDRRDKLSVKLDPNNELHQLYSQYYNYLDKYNITAIKIKGHDKKSNRVTEHEQIFDSVDKYTRKVINQIDK